MRKRAHLLRGKSRGRHQVSVIQSRTNGGCDDKYREASEVTGEGPDSWPEARVHFHPEPRSALKWKRAKHAPAKNLSVPREVSRIRAAGYPQWSIASMHSRTKPIDRWATEWVLSESPENAPSPEPWFPRTGSGSSMAACADFAVHPQGRPERRYSHSSVGALHDSPVLKMGAPCFLGRVIPLVARGSRSRSAPE